MTQQPEHAILGQTVDGRYRVEKHLADGGMAGVYIAHDTRLGREVALKILRPDLARSPQFASRFEREARAAARLSHPNIVAVQDQGNDGSVVFLVMELVRGTTLRDVIDAGGVSVERALELFDGVLAGLAAAHDAGLAHGDVKPENVLVDTTGAVKITDFGLARAVTGAENTSDMLLGTASYIAPELVEHGGLQTSRSDVYSAGLVLYELLTGRRAFDGSPAINVAFQHVNGPVPQLAAPSASGQTDEASSQPSSSDDADENHRPLPEEVRTAFDPALALACAKDPAERPSDAGSLRRTVRQAASTLTPESLAFASTSARHADPTAAPGGHTEVIGSSSHTKILAAGSSPQGPSHRRRWPWIAGITALALAAVGIGVGTGVFSHDDHTVPAVHGMTKAAAEGALRDAGFTVTDASRHGQEKAGTALETSPKEGASADDGSAVTLYVSSGPEHVSLPSLAGQSESDARAKLESLGLNVATSEKVASAQPAGTVVGTNPGAGSSVAGTQSVTLQVSSGSTAPAAGQVSVPSVVGLPAGSAKAVLGSFGLQATLPAAGEGTTVTSQSPSAGTFVASGTTVQLQ